MVCDCCPDVWISIEINSIAVLNIYAVDYSCIVEITAVISVSEFINSLKNFDFSVKSKQLNFLIYFILMYKKQMKKLKCSVILKLKSVNFAIIKNPYF